MTFYEDDSVDNDVVIGQKRYCDCGEMLDIDCFGEQRCPHCDPPCPGCADGPGPGAEVTEGFCCRCGAPFEDCVCTRGGD